MARRYRSAVRDERANRTREALLDAYEQLLLEMPVEEVTLPAVAQRAGVTKPTAYSHFPDLDALLAAFLDHVRDRIGMDKETLAGTAPEKLPAAVRDNYRRYDANARLLQRVMDSSSYNRVRLSRRQDRAAMVIPAWNGAASERTLKQLTGPIYMLVTPASWRWLRETWGLSSEDAARAAAWAAETLVAALSQSERVRSKQRRAATKRAKEHES